MGGYRAERIAELIHREVAEMLQRDVRDPRMVPISITRVEVTRDLRRATVEYLPLGGGEPSEQLVEGLDSVARQLRGPVGRALRIRHAPEIVFAYDTHTEQAIRVTSLLDRIGQELKGSEPAAAEPAAVETVAEEPEPTEGEDQP